MGDRTELMAIQRDGNWTVRIAWPSGFNHHYGKFVSEREAGEWIEAHRWMTGSRIEEHEILRRRTRQSPN